MSKYLIDSDTMESIASSIKQLSGNSGTLDGANLASTLSSAITNKVDSSNIRNPVLIDTIDIASFSEPVNAIVIDPTQYDLGQYNVFFIHTDDIVSSAQDWLYFCSEGGNNLYFAGDRTNHSFSKIFFVKNGTNWKDVIYTTWAGRFPPNGDRTGLWKINFHFYNSTTVFVSGRLNIYAL